MAADSSHRVIMAKPSCDHSSAFIFEGKDENHKISDDFEFRPDRRTAELAVLERLEKSP